MLWAEAGKIGRRNDAPTVCLAFFFISPQVSFLVGVAGKGRMMDRQSATKQLPSTSCERFHGKLYRQHNYMLEAPYHL